MKLKNNNYNYDKSKTLTLNFVNSFDDEVEIKNTTITYQIKDSLKKKVQKIQKIIILILMIKKMIIQIH
jgi:hypothetical protein